MDKWLISRLIQWYRQNHRDLPWRHHRDPYKIWLSEIILQQTQVVQGLAYYNRFTETYPTVNDLASASEDEVLKLWQGLGYYSRARNMLAAAKSIVRNHGGNFPDSYEHIRALKGVGDYTAAAIASFAFDLPYGVVDGNVFRFLSRFFAIRTAIDTTKGKKEFTALANSLIDKKHPGIYNQAIMEFGSQYCKPTKPNCPACIFSTRCMAYNQGKAEAYPVKEKRTKVKKRYFNYLVLTDTKGQLLLHKRGAGDIWQGLYEFVLVESDRILAIDELISGKDFAHWSGSHNTVLHESKIYRHLLSHQELLAKFFVVRCKKLMTQKTFVKIKGSDLHKHAFARLTEKFLNDYELKEIF